MQGLVQAIRWKYLAHPCQALGKTVILPLFGSTKLLYCACFCLSVLGGSRFRHCHLVGRIVIRTQETCMHTGRSGRHRHGAIAVFPTVRMSWRAVYHQHPQVSVRVVLLQASCQHRPRLLASLPARFCSVFPTRKSAKKNVCMRKLNESMCL